MIPSNQAARLLIDPAGDGAWNMAVDQAILQSVASAARPVLRIYLWHPATLSLGYFQSFDQRSQHPESTGCPVVRRSSGGGAILHHHELTYSLCLPASNRWAKKNTELYAKVHRCILAALSQFSVDAECYARLPASGVGNSDHFLCFERRSDGDLILDGFKIVGSAQRRSRHAIIQHGSILFGRSEFAPQLPGINDLANGIVDETAFVTLMIDIVCENLRIVVQTERLSEQENELARQICESRFANDAWTRQRH